MLKFKNKNLIEKTNSSIPHDKTNSLFHLDKQNDIEEINQDIFKEVVNLKNENDDAYVDVNTKKFKHLLSTKQYVDYEYLALQMYLLQEKTDWFKYWEIKKILVKIIDFIEDILLEWKNVSIGDKIYICSSKEHSIKIDNKLIPRIYIQKEKPEGPIFLVKNIDINLDGIRELSLYKLIIKNFDSVLIDLLERINQVLLGNIIIMKMESSYVIIPSEKFFFTHLKARDLPTTLEIAQSKNLETSNNLIKSSLKPNKSTYKIQQIFLNKNNKKYKKVDSNNKHRSLISEMKDKLTIFKIKKEPKTPSLEEKLLTNEITDVNSRIKTFKKIISKT